MIRLEITADTPEAFRAHMAEFAGLFVPRIIMPERPDPGGPNFGETRWQGTDSDGVFREEKGEVSARPAEPVAEEQEVIPPAEPRRGPGRPRKNPPKPEPITIDGTATEVKDVPATADPSPAIVVPDEGPEIVEAIVIPVIEPAAPPVPFLALDPLKDAYTLDEVRKLAMEYVKAMVVDAKGNTDRDAARGVLKGLLGAFGVEGVGGLDEPQRLAMVKLIHHLAPFGRTPPAADTFAGIVASFGG